MCFFHVCFTWYIIGFDENLSITFAKTKFAQSLRRLSRQGPLLPITYVNVRTTIEFRRIILSGARARACCDTSVPNGQSRPSRRPRETSVVHRGRGRSCSAVVLLCTHGRTPPPAAAAAADAEAPTADDDGARHWWRRDEHTAGYRLSARNGSSSGNTVVNGFSVLRSVRVRLCVCVFLPRPTCVRAISRPCVPL